MPTASGRETAAEKGKRQREEWFAAVRAARTPEMVDEAKADVLSYIAGDPMPEYGAGDRLSLRAGRRIIEVDEGEVRQLALADALIAEDFTVISHKMSFGIAQGRNSIFYSVGVKTP